MEVIFDKVSSSYDPHSPIEKLVLNEISFKWAESQSLGIVGRTGSGKSTLIQHMNGLLYPTKGTIKIGQIEIQANRKKHPPLFQQVGVVFQYPEHQLFEETVLKDVSFGPTNLGWSKEKVQEQSERALSAVGLDQSFYQRSPFQLSGGEKRRVAIAGVLAMEPSILILDEPTAGLDPQGKEHILDLVKGWLKQDKERKVVMITHNMDDIAELVDEVLVLSAGKIKWHTDPFTLFTKHKEELQELHLELPQAVQLIEHLNTKLNPPIELFSVKKEDIVKQIASYIKKQQGKEFYHEPVT